MVCKNFDEIDNKFQILDINSSVGFVGRELTKKLPDNVIINAVECSNIMSEFLVKSNDLYSDVTDFDKFFQSSDKRKYNIIFSVLGLEYLQKLSTILIAISKRMSKNTLLGLVFRKSKNNQVSLNNNKTYFTYDRKFLEKELDVADFEIDDIKESRLYNNDYIYIVCTKK